MEKEKKIYSFNKGLITTLEPITLAKLKLAKEKMEKIKSNEIKLEDGIDEAISAVHNISRSLDMAKLNEHIFMRKLEEVLLLIKNRKTMSDSIDVSIEVLSVFTEYFETKMKKLTETGENDFYPMEMWNEYEKLNQILGSEYKYQDLFFPFAEFTLGERQELVDIDNAILNEKTTLAFQDYINKAEEWLNSKATQNDIVNARLALKKMYNVVKYFLNLKKQTQHYQGYLLALEARILLAYSDEKAELDRPKNFQKVIKTSINELQNFRKGASKQISIENLKIVLDKFLIPKNYEDIKEEPLIQEVVKRFNINKFLEKASLAINKEEKVRKDDFKKHFNVMKKMVEFLNNHIENIKEAYNEKIASSDSQEKSVELSGKPIQDFYVFLLNVLKYREITNQNISEIYDSLEEFVKYLRSGLESKKSVKFDFDIIEEYAGLLFIFLKYIDSKENVNEDFINFAKMQAIRARKSLSDDKSYLSKNKLNWYDLGKINRESSFRTVYEKTKISLSKIKEDFYELVDKGDKLKSNDIIEKISNIMSILKMAKYDKAVDIFQHLGGIFFNHMKEDKFIFSEEEREKIIKIIQSLEVFVEVLAKGDENNPYRYIQDVYQELFNRNIQENNKKESKHIQDYSSHEDEKEILKTNENVVEKYDVKDEPIIKKSAMNVNLVDADNENILEEKSLNKVNYLKEEELIKEVQEVENENKNKLSTYKIEDKEEEVQENNEEEIQQDEVEIQNEKREEYLIEETDNNIEEEEEENDRYVVDYLSIDDDFKEMLEITVEEYENDLLPVHEKALKDLRNHNLDFNAYKLAKKELKRVAHTMKGSTIQLDIQNLHKMYALADKILGSKVEDDKKYSDDFLTVYDNLFKYLEKFIDKIKIAINNSDSEIELKIDKVYVDELVNLLEDIYYNNKSIDVEDKIEEDNESNEHEEVSNDYVVEIEDNKEENEEQTLDLKEHKDVLFELEQEIKQENSDFKEINDVDYSVEEDEDVEVVNEEKEDKSNFEKIDNIDNYAIEEDEDTEIEHKQNEEKVEKEDFEEESTQEKETVFNNVVKQASQVFEQGQHLVGLDGNDLKQVCESLDTIASEILKLKTMLLKKIEK